MVMHDFEYVPNEEWKPIREELFELIHRLQDEVRDKFTFQYHFVGNLIRQFAKVFYYNLIIYIDCVNEKGFRS